MATSRVGRQSKPKVFPGLSTQSVCPRAAPRAEESPGAENAARALLCLHPAGSAAPSSAAFRLQVSSLPAQAVQKEPASITSAVLCSGENRKRCPGATEDKRCPLQPMPVKALSRGGCSNAGRQMRKASCAVLCLPHGPVSSLLHTAKLSRAQHRGCALSNLPQGRALHPHPEAAPLLHSGIKPLVQICGQHNTSGGVAGAGRGGQTSPRCSGIQQA